MSISINDPVTALSGVGPQMALKLARVHVQTVQDVLFHLPHRYEDRTSVSNMGAVFPTLSTVVIGQIDLAQVVYGRRRSLLVRISDGTGNITIRMFYFNRAQEKSFQRGLWVKCFGEVRPGAKGFEMIHPEYRVSATEPEGGFDNTLTPVYPTTEGVSQNLWRKLSDQVLEEALPQINELVDAQCLPPNMQGVYQASSLQQAIFALHRPSLGVNLQSMQEANSDAHQRLIMEELLAHHFSLRKSRAAREHEKAPLLEKDKDLEQPFLDNLGFALTDAQRRVSLEVAADLFRTTPSMRLIQGDVGSGKTVVAALAMLQAVSARVQCVLMAPTELLAEQHFATIGAWWKSSPMVSCW